MKTLKTAVSASIVMIGFASSAHALPAFSTEAPESSVRQCVERIGSEANYEGAGRVRHAVDSKERPVSGHTISIDTTVFGGDGSEVIREYRTVCAVSDASKTRHFRIKEMSRS